MVPLLLETVPVPAPAVLTMTVCWSTVNCAVTDTIALTVTLQVGVAPAHTPPDQPVKVEPAAGVAVRTTIVPFM